MNEIYSYANIFDVARNENYIMYNSECAINQEQINNKEIFIKMLDNYLQKIITNKSKKIINPIEHVKKFVNAIVEHITGDYEIGIGEFDFNTLTEHTETISAIIAYSETDELETAMTQEEKYAEGIASASIASAIIPSNEENKARERFKLTSSDVKSFFKNAVNNIANINRVVANGIAHIAGMDKEESKGLNDNILGKFFGGLAYEFISGTLFEKRHFTSVMNSNSMQDKIKSEGILHFTSPANIEKIMEQGKLKPSNFLESDLTRKKTFFFAGKPTFEDLLINIPAYDVMTAIRIHPTDEQLEKLKYRAINDRAIVQDGAFEFGEGQAEIAYFGLMYDKEKDIITLGELTKEQASEFEVSDEVKRAYHYEPKKNSLLDNIKINAYGFFAEYKHHQKLIQMQEILREHRNRKF